VLLISVFLATIFGIWQFVFKIDVFNHGFHYIGEYVRVQSTQDAPNAYGSCLAMVLPICMCLFAFERTTWKKILFAILILLIFSNILLSFSRGAIISTFFALFAVAFISKNRVLMNIFALAITIGVLMFACYGLGGFQKELISRFKVCFNPKADLTRVYLFKSAWEIFKDKPLFGSGFGTFKKIYWDDKIKAGIPPETIPGGALNSCHNNLLQIACETGLFSLIGFLWVIGLFFYRSISFYRRNKDILEGYLVLGIIGAVIAFFVHGMVDYTFGLVSTSHLFWYFLGVVAFIIGKDINKKI
jgi:O-antigen ligase